MPELTLTGTTPSTGSYTYVAAVEPVANGLDMDLLTGRRIEILWIDARVPSQTAALSDSRTYDEVIWGPAVVDEEVLEAMRRVEAAGYQPLGAEPLPLQDA